MLVPGEDDQTSVGHHGEDDSDGHAAQPDADLGGAEVLDSEVPLDHGLIDSIDGHPGEVSTNGLGPECVSGEEGGVQVEYFNSVVVIVHIKHCPRTTHHPLSYNNNHQTREQHAEGLEHVCPNDRLDTPEAGVEDADAEGDEDGEVNIETSDLGQSKTGGIDHDGEVEAGEDDVAESGEHSHLPVKPSLKIGVS